MSMEPVADRQIFAAPCLEEPPAKPHGRGSWFFAASFAVHLAVLGMVWFLGSLLPPTGNGDFDGVVITLTYGKPGSGAAGEPASGGGGSAKTEQNAVPQADAAAPAAEAAAAQKETSPAHQEQEKTAESTVADSQSPLAIPRLAEKTAVKEKPQPAKIDKTTKATPRKEQNVQHREQADSNTTAKVADLKPGTTTAGASSGANAGVDSGAGSGANQSKLQGQGMSLAEGSGPGRGSGSSGQGNGAASEGQGDAGGYLKGNYEYIKKRIRKYLEYSPQAKRMGIQGLVYVAFTITRDGSAQNVELRTSSGFDSLDESALEAVHRASPFAPPPQAARVVVPIQFSLK
ncbi:energy transducer TonB [Desulfovibrio desulfuricans]|uniref:energy transducer TonB n=1 Tax=Desulfovibrio desulfuricans TaxID=876 RepID=UPI001C03762F|nr:energy transducer TonB [Desulfovibrio desulfuricans]MBT9748638.1 TonB family protein [Desulfovibrio desulfuricans]